MDPNNWTESSPSSHQPQGCYVNCLASNQPMIKCYNLPSWSNYFTLCHMWCLKRRACFWPADESAYLVLQAGGHPRRCCLSTGWPGKWSGVRTWYVIRSLFSQWVPPLAVAVSCSRRIVMGQANEKIARVHLDSGLRLGSLVCSFIHNNYSLVDVPA